MRTCDDVAIQRRSHDHVVIHTVIIWWSLGGHNTITWLQGGHSIITYPAANHMKTTSNTIAYRIAQQSHHCCIVRPAVSAAYDSNTCSKPSTVTSAHYTYHSRVPGRKGEVCGAHLAELASRCLHAASATRSTQMDSLTSTSATHMGSKRESMLIRSTMHANPKYRKRSSQRAGT